MCRVSSIVCQCAQQSLLCEVMLSITALECPSVQQQALCPAVSAARQLQHNVHIPLSSVVFTESDDGTILFKFGSEAEAAAAGGPAAAPEPPAQSAEEGPGEPAAAASEPAPSHASEAPAPVEAAAPQGQGNSTDQLPVSWLFVRLTQNRQTKLCGQRSC